MHKTRNLFSAKTAQKGFRVFDLTLFLCAKCYRIFILQLFVVIGGTVGITFQIAWAIFKEIHNNKK